MTPSDPTGKPLPSNALRKYKEEVETYEPLSDQETRLLFQHIAHTSNLPERKVLQDRMAKAYLSFVIDIAESFTDIELILVDYIQEGNIALLDAIGQYTAEMKESFLEFCTPRIYAALQRYREEHPLPIPPNIQVIPASTTYEGEEKE